jgi:hypothetical protein
MHEAGKSRGPVAEAGPYTKVEFGSFLLFEFERTLALPQRHTSEMCVASRSLHFALGRYSMCSPPCCFTHSTTPSVGGVAHCFFTSSCKARACSTAAWISPALGAVSRESSKAAPRKISSFWFMGSLPSFPSLVDLISWLFSSNLAVTASAFIGTNPKALLPDP